MTFAQLQAFATVARLGSVNGAARALGVSEPAISEHVAGLRRDLGDELFVRAAGGIRLTPGGTRLAAAGAGRETPTGAFLRRHHLAPDEVRAYASDAAAASAAASGRGVMLAIAHTVLDELHRGSLARLDVIGTPVDGLWFASTLRPDRR